MLQRCALLAGVVLICVALCGQEKPPSSQAPVQATSPIAPHTNTQDAPKPDTAPDQSPQALAQNVPPDSKGLEPIKVVKASYPAAVGANELQGEVIIKVNVSETGDVERAEVVSGNAILGHAAMDAAKKWKFKPFIRNGKPVKVSTNIPFDFAFKDKVTDAKLKPEPSSPSSGVGTQAADQSGTGLQGDSQVSRIAVQRVRIAQGVTQGMVIHKSGSNLSPRSPTGASTRDGCFSGNYRQRWRD